MGLTFNQRDATAAAHPLVGDPDKTARKERLQALNEAARRINDEFAAIYDRQDKLFLDYKPVLTRIIDDPSTDPSELDGFFLRGKEIADQLRALIPSYTAVNRELAAVKYEETLAHGRAKEAADMAKNAELWESFARLKQTVGARARAAAQSTDASSTGDLDSETARDHD